MSDESRPPEERPGRLPGGVPGERPAGPGERSGQELGSVLSPGDFDDLYTSTPPWDIGRPQGVLEQLARSGALVGTVLDVGCGTGEHALLAAALGHRAVGVDSAPRAVGIARRKAAERGVEVEFLVWDALELASLGEQFDTVLDCGLFHVFDDGNRALFVESLAAAIPPGGRYHMLCFSDRQLGDWGPRRVTREEIRASFARGWRVDSVEPAVLELTIDSAGAQAWLSAITRL